MSYSLTVVQTRFLGLAGGSDVTETTRAILKRLMSSAVAKMVNWKGKGGKKPFGSMNLLPVVCG